MALTKVTRTGITDNSINAAKIEDGTIVDADITPGTITNAKLAGSIANAKLANSSITINGSAVSLGGSVSAGSLAWQSVVVSDGSTVTTMVAGRGYFVNNSSAAGIVKLPTSASAGDTIAIKDYAANFGTNSLTIQRNGHNIQGAANNSEITTNRASLVLVYIDATKGWLYTNESNVSNLGPEFISATGGTIINSGNDRIHVFTGDGNFVVSSLGNCAGGGAKVSYMVVAGGGGTGPSSPGGGGAGGFREGKDTPKATHTASPKAAACSGLTVSVQTYPISVGGGGGNASPRGASGSNSVFSTITSAGGGGGGSYSGPTAVPGNPGGSGGGGNASNTGNCSAGGTGNTPPVSPPQGNNGGVGAGNAGAGWYAGGGGGGANNTGQPHQPPQNGGYGGVGAGTQIVPSSYGETSSCNQFFAGGGGGAGPLGTDGARGTGNPPSNANTGGGGHGANTSSGGKGIVVIRYKYQ